MRAVVTDVVQSCARPPVVVAKMAPLGYSNTNYSQYIAKIPDVVNAAHGAGRS